MAPSTSPKVVFVAIPLMARSGVYRSTYDLVRTARAAGHDWTALVGMRPNVPGERQVAEGVSEFTLDEHGGALIPAIQRALHASEVIAQADVVVTLITQSDIAVRRASLGKYWVAYVRGLPWPAPGEQSRLRSILLRRLETSALRAADDVWATTDLLAQQISVARLAHVVPAGIPMPPRVADGTDASSPLVWAGRIDVDKRPQLFLDLAAASGHKGLMFGDGPLRAEMGRSRQSSVEVRGWAEPDELWQKASMFVGTAYREAFGRSAVEAAASGLPVVLSDGYGAAPLLLTDPALRDVAIVRTSEPSDWAARVRLLLDDDDLRTRMSDHVHTNALRLSIERSVERIDFRLAHI